MDRVNLILNNKTFLDNYNIIQHYEKEREFCKHNLSHSLDVARIMYIKNLEEKLNLDKEIIYATALLHDIGRSLDYSKNINHNIGGVKIANEILKQCQFIESEIKIILSAIKNHNCDDDIPLNKLLRYGDRLSRNCFICNKYNECYWKDEKKTKGIIL